MSSVRRRRDGITTDGTTDADAMIAVADTMTAVVDMMTAVVGMMIDAVMTAEVDTTIAEAAEGTTAGTIVRTRETIALVACASTGEMASVNEVTLVGFRTKTPLVK